MEKTEAEAIADLLRTVRMGLVIMAICAGYLSREELLGFL